MNYFYEHASHTRTRFGYNRYYYIVTHSCIYDIRVHKFIRTRTPLSLLSIQNTYERVCVIVVIIIFAIL